MREIDVTADDDRRALHQHAPQRGQGCRRRTRASADTEGRGERAVGAAAVEPAITIWPSACNAAASAVPLFGRAKVTVPLSPQLWSIAPFAEMRVTVTNPSSLSPTARMWLSLVVSTATFPPRCTMPFCALS